MNQVIAYSIILLLVAAAGGGYYLGYEHGSNPSEERMLREKVSQQAEQLTFLEASVRKLELNQGSRAYSDSDDTEAPSDQQINKHALRAEQSSQIFTDRQGRELVARIIEVGADSSRVERESDRRIFTLRHVDLIAEDRAFLQYLYGVKRKEEEKRKADEAVLEAIFAQ